MSSAYVIGHITVKNADAWAEYRARVPATLKAWGGEPVLRGRQVAALAGANPHADVVVLRFPSVEAVQQWFSSPDYQALIPVREQGATVDLLVYEG